MSFIPTLSSMKTRGFGEDEIDVKYMGIISG